MNTLAKVPVILVIEHEYITFDFIKNIVLKENLSIVEAKTGQAGLRKAEITQPDLILLSANLTDISGFEICTQLKQHANTAHIPVILLLQNNQVADKIKTFEVKAVDYILKPIEPKEFIARIRIHLEYHQLQKRLQSEIEFSEQLKEKLQEQNKELTKQNKVLRSLSSIDEITQTANRYRLDEHLEQEWSRMTRETKPFGIVFLGVDELKKYIFEYGNDAADSVLLKIAQLIKQQLKRPGDLVGRYQREVFMLILPNTAYEGCLFIAKEIKDKIDNLKIVHKTSSISTHITLSIGVSALIPYPQMKLEQLTQAAYIGFTTARTNGGNNIVFKEVEGQE